MHQRIVQAGNTVVPALLLLLTATSADVAIAHLDGEPERLDRG
jgi:hypothetical protein